MKKTSSVSKDGSNLRKSHFGCYFHHGLVNFKNFIILFGTYGSFMVLEKIEEVLLLIRNISKGTYQKGLIVCDSELLNLIPESSTMKWAKNTFNKYVSRMLIFMLVP